VGYEAFFIPAGAKSAANVCDSAEFLSSMDEAKAAAVSEYCQGL
jgi:hypothetical protein